MGKWKSLWIVMGVVIAYIAFQKMSQGKDDKQKMIEDVFRKLTDRLGVWAMPSYVMLHTLTLAFCLPWAVIFEAGAAILFGFARGVFCVFAAKILGASLSFFIGRLLFRSSSSRMGWVKNNKYFHVLTKGVARDGWRFVLLARFSPVPSYVINYGLAATDVRFFMDFLLPTIIGCIPMILQNTSIGSLTSAAVMSDPQISKSKISSYLFPMLGILSSILISMRIKKYSSEIKINDDEKPSVDDTKNPKQDVPEGSRAAPIGKKTLQ
eukprot:TRINITY_DN6477_c0_g1_i1.p1 TRINITY_DN6477_c0_g1~~TRINITY_DN6477_c0_g1_i1.p1  ORF type:complete len:266 (+),score=36.06 TRINITY_DN6477_c0_g1_i1:217-1014(+)